MNERLLPLPLQIFAAVVLMALLLRVVVLVRQHRLNLRDSLLWVTSTGFALFVTVFPQSLASWASLLGIAVPSNALFGGAFVYILVNLLGGTIAASENASRSRRLAQECTLLRAEVDDLRSRMTSRPS